MKRMFDMIEGLFIHYYQSQQRKYEHCNYWASMMDYGIIPALDEFA